MLSLHGKLAPVALQDLVSDHYFLRTAPPVFVSPNVAPTQEVGHWNHRAGKPTHECLFTDDWEEHESHRGSEEPVLQTSKLVLHDPLVAFLKVVLANWRDVAVVN